MKPARVPPLTAQMVGMRELRRSFLRRARRERAAYHSPKLGYARDENISLRGTRWRDRMALWRGIHIGKPKEGKTGSFGSQNWDGGFKH